MGLKKGQTNNPRGRPKGKPNKATTDLRTFINELLQDNLDLIVSDLGRLESRDRLQILEKLMQYVIPKQQSISAEAQIQVEYASLEKLLSDAPDEAIRAITDRLIKLNKMSTKV